MILPGGRGETHPQLERCGTGQRRIGDIDVTDDDGLRGSHPLRASAGGVWRWRVGHRDLMANQVWLNDIEQDQRPCAQPSVLAECHVTLPTVRPSCMGSTTMSTGSPSVAPLAKIVCTVRTRLLQIRSRTDDVDVNTVERMLKAAEAIDNADGQPEK